MNPPPRLVLVEWEDASVVDEGTWVDRGKAPPPVPVIFQQVGWLMEMTAAHVVVTSTLSPELMAPRDRIPRGMVRSIHTFDISSGAPLAKQRKR